MKEIISPHLSAGHADEYLIDCNRLREAGFEEWLFYPGMLFMSPDKWWGNGGCRPAPHEGSDFCLWRDRNGRRFRLDGNTRIPAMFEGEVVGISDDFLGKSVYMRHDICDSRGSRLYTLLGHTAPRDSLRKGSQLDQGEVFAHISVRERKKMKIPPHLHISVAWMDASYPDEKLGWEMLGRTPEIRLLDPLEVIGCKYAITRPSGQEKKPRRSAPESAANMRLQDLRG